MIEINSGGVRTAKRLIENEKIDRNSAWSFSSDDGNAILEDGWTAYSDVHLAIETDAEAETKAYYKFPVIKNGQVYRRGVIAAKARAAAQNYQNVFEVADELLKMIDEVKGLAKLIKAVANWFKPESKITGSFSVKMVGEKYRWLGVTTNKFVDRENEILTDQAHVEFMNYLDANPDQAPELWTWHTPGTARKHKADWWDYSNGFVLYSGELTEEEALPYINNKNLEPLGMSHGFRVLERQGRYITRYRTFEVSELPVDTAANPYTNFDTILTMEVKTMFTQRKRQFIVDRYGEEAVAKLEGDLEGQEKTLIELGTDWKSLDAEYVVDMETRLAEKAAEIAKPQADAQVAMIVKEVVKALSEPVKTLNENVLSRETDIEEIKAVLEPIPTLIKTLTDRVAVLEFTKDEWVADAIAPIAPVVKSATTSDDNVIDAPEEIAKQVKEALGGSTWFNALKPVGGVK